MNNFTKNKKGLLKAQSVGIKTIPTLIFYKGQEEIKRFVGLPEKVQLENSYQELSESKH